MSRDSLTHGHQVLAQETFDLPGSVVDGELRPVLHVAGGFQGVVEAVDLWWGDTGSGPRGPGKGLKAGAGWGPGVEA